HLAELDVGGAEALQRARQADTGRGRIVPGAAAAEKPAQKTRLRRQQRLVLPREKRVGARPAPGGMPQTKVIRDAAHQSFQAECIAATPPVRLRTFTRPRPACSIIFAKRACEGKRRMLSAR